MNINELETLLNNCYGLETCYPGLRKNWRKENGTLGHCAIVALVVNDYFGGQIMRCLVDEVGHYFNIIDNSIVDLTKSQFGNNHIDYDNSYHRSRDYILSNEETKERYMLLLEKLKYEIKNKLILKKEY